MRRRSRGQHFLRDERVIERIVEYAGIGSEETILEIGPGYGNLTDKLVEKAGRVIAIEVDKDLFGELENKYRGRDNIELIHADAMKIDLPEVDKAVSNLPYSISSRITFRLIGLGFRLAVLMYQYEFARRMTAEFGSKNYGRLSIAVNYYTTPRILEVVPRSAFYPMPEVTSAVVELKPRKPPYSVRNEDFFMDFITAIFTQRRKTLRKALLKTGHMLPQLDITKALDDIPEDYLKLRAEQIPADKLAEISNIIYCVG